MTSDSGNGQHFQGTRYTWSLRRVRWRLVLEYQHWCGVLLFATGALASGIAHWTMTESPHIRPALVYDATISYPQVHNMIISNSLATTLNWICFVIAVLTIELVIFHKQHSLTAAITAIIHHTLFCVVTFFIVVGVAEVTKPFVGRLRPDFLARCQPANAVDSSSNFSTALSDHSATFQQIHLGEQTGDCISAANRDGGVTNGRLSFVSGHASNSLSTAWYTALYIMWSLYLRVDNPYVTKLYVATSVRGRIVQEVAYALAYGFILLTICLSWFIGVTRFWDNVHAVSDILGGFLIAIIFSTPLVVKAIGWHIMIQSEVEDAVNRQ